MSSPQVACGPAPSAKKLWTSVQPHNEEQPCPEGQAAMLHPPQAQVTNDGGS